MEKMAKGSLEELGKTLVGEEDIEVKGVEEDLEKYSNKREESTNEIEGIRDRVLEDTTNMDDMDSIYHESISKEMLGDLLGVLDEEIIGDEDEALKKQIIIANILQLEEEERNQVLVGE